MDKEKKDDFSEVTQCACFSLRRASRIITQHFDAHLKSSRLGASQFSLLAALRKCGDVSMTELGNLLAVDRTTLTRNCSVLAKEGLIQIREGDDKRVRILSITSSGRKKLSEALPLWRKAQEEVIAPLGEEKFQEMQNLLSLLTKERRSFRKERKRK